MAQQTVRDVTDRDPAAVTTRTAFKDLVALLLGRETSAVAVLGPKGHLAGLVTEKNLLRKQALQADPAGQRPVRRASRARWALASGTGGKLVGLVAPRLLTAIRAVVRPPRSGGR